MKRILCATLLAVMLVTPAFSATVYLRDGGVIQAKRVWRAGGKVHVLATRHTFTSFDRSEVDLKRTFVKRHRAAKSIAGVQSQSKITAATPNGAAARQVHDQKTTGATRSILPKLPQKSPENPVPSSDGGAITQHKKKMAEKVVE